jgi:hypothetical protein
MNTKTESSVRSVPGGPKGNPERQPTALELELRWNTLLGQEDLLREEIARGKQCLAQARKELADSRSRLEEWPTYEDRCGVHCLPCLTESVARNRRIERFLNGWLARRKKQLTEVEEAVARLARDIPTHLRQTGGQVLAH